MKNVNLLKTKKQKYLKIPADTIGATKGYLLKAPMILRNIARDEQQEKVNFKLLFITNMMEIL